MTARKHICDRCGDVILSDRTALDVRCGPLRTAGLGSVDLCEGCSSNLVDWLKAPTLEGAGRR